MSTPGALRSVHRDDVRAGTDNRFRAGTDGRQAGGRHPVDMNRNSPTIRLTAAVVAAAALAAEPRGFTHRDYQSRNLMVRPDGVVKLTDFGIAQARDATPLTRTGMVVGTAQYLSPEQAKGEQVDARSDLYSTGCLLYELVTGHPLVSWDYFTLVCVPAQLLNGAAVLRYPRRTCPGRPRPPDGGERPTLPSRLGADSRPAANDPPANTSAATSTAIPIVTVGASDPVASGLAVSLARPGGNLTGFAQETGAEVTKRLQLLREVVPKLTRVATLSGVGMSYNPYFVTTLQEAARGIGVSVLPFEIRNVEDVNHAFVDIEGARADGDGGQLLGREALAA